MGVEHIWSKILLWTFFFEKWSPITHCSTPIWPLHHNSGRNLKHKHHSVLCNWLMLSFGQHTSTLYKYACKETKTGSWRQMSDILLWLCVCVFFSNLHKANCSNKWRVTINLSTSHAVLLIHMGKSCDFILIWLNLNYSKTGCWKYIALYQLIIYTKGTLKDHGVLQKQAIILMRISPWPPKRTVAFSLKDVYLLSQDVCLLLFYSNIFFRKGAIITEVGESPPVPWWTSFNLLIFLISSGAVGQNTQAAIAGNI